MESFFQLRDIGSLRKMERKRISPLNVALHAHVLQVCVYCVRFIEWSVANPSSLPPSSDIPPYFLQSLCTQVPKPPLSPLFPFSSLQVNQAAVTRMLIPSD